MCVIVLLSRKKHCIEVKWYTVELTDTNIVNLKILMSKCIKKVT